MQIDPKLKKPSLSLSLSLSFSPAPSLKFSEAEGACVAQPWPSQAEPQLDVLYVPTLPFFEWVSICFYLL